MWFRTHYIDDDETLFVVVRILLDRFDDSDLVVGARKIELQAYAADDEVEIPLPPAVLKTLSLREALLHAIRHSSRNTDGSPVSKYQAECLAGFRNGGTRHAQASNDNWRRVAEAWVSAKLAGKRQTTPDVIKAGGYEPSQAAAARMMVSKAKSKGVLREVAIEMGATVEQRRKWKLEGDR